MSNKVKPKSKPLNSAATQAAARSWWQSPIVWVVALVLVAGTIAVIGASSPGPTTTAQTAAAETIGSPLPAFTEPDPAVGSPAPTISAQTLAGERTTLTGDGTARLYGFFAHWCPHCQAELPKTVQWLETDPLPEGVEVVAVSTSVDRTADNYPPTDWFDREKWPATVLLDSDESAIASGFGLTSFPFWVAVDADGVVVKRIAGAIPEQDLDALVNEIAPAA